MYRGQAGAVRFVCFRMLAYNAAVPKAILVLGCVGRPRYYGIGGFAGRHLVVVLCTYKSTSTYFQYR